MDHVPTIEDLRVTADRWRSEGQRVGLVPTMGYLHEGHVSLVEAAVADCDRVVVTIFVNPLQFAPGEDLSTYPRDPDGDAAKAAAAGASVLFVPSDGEMYPGQVLTSVSVAEISARYEGASRPTHFSGVATVVTKLFSIVGPCRAYFGEKDFQQLAVVRRLTRDLSLPVDVIGCPTVREPDGLAMSSRNAYLTVEEREVAPLLAASLRSGAVLIEAGITDGEAIRSAMSTPIEAEPLATLDYIDLVDPDTLEPLSSLENRRTPVRLIGAMQLGRPRLLDNVSSSPPAG